MKVLVTGSKGQVGRCLQDTSKDYPEIQFVFTDREELDITDKHAVEAFIGDHRFDYCINCAAYTAVDLAETQREEAFLINAEAVKNLAEACLETDCILIHISTDFVFDGTKTTPYTEDDEPNPINVYGASKLKGEQHVQEILKKYFIIRTSWVYSEYGNNFVKTMIRLACEKKDIKVVNDQFGNPTYAFDLALFTLSLIALRRKEFGMYHYTNQGITSWFEFARQIIELKNPGVNIMPIYTEEFPTAAKRPKNSSLDLDKLIQTFSCVVPDWNQSLIECMKQIKLSNSRV